MRCSDSLHLVTQHYCHCAAGNKLGVVSVFDAATAETLDEFTRFVETTVKCDYTFFGQTFSLAIDRQQRRACTAATAAVGHRNASIQRRHRLSPCRRFGRSGTARRGRFMFVQAQGDVRPGALFHVALVRVGQDAAELCLS